MLSPGKWYRDVPTDPRENVPWRRKMYEAARQSRRVRRGLLEMCRLDFFFYAAAFVWQTNPDMFGHEDGPMIAFPFQEQAVRLVMEELFERRRDVLVEKSRKLGWSWWALILFDWLCAFHERKTCYAVSHSEDAVDKPDDPNCLFWKVMFIHDRLPTWLARGVRHKKLSFYYPATQSAFTGGATTERSGVGGRAHVLLDELAKQLRAEEIWSQTADTGPRLAISTHYGISGKFFELTQEQGERLKIISHWSEHPHFNKGLYRYDRAENKVEILDKAYHFPPDYHFVKDGEPSGGPFPCVRAPWYDFEDRRRQSRREMAIHIDINPQGSVSQFFNGVIINTRIREHCRSPIWTGDIVYDKETGVPETLVQMDDGPLRLWVQPDGRGRLPVARYGAAADVSTGQGATPSCIQLLNGTAGQQAGEYTTATIDEKALAPLAIALCALCVDEHGDSAVLNWEVQGPGAPFGKRVMELGYRRLYMRPKDNIVNHRQSEKPGWNNTPDTARELLDLFRMAIYGGDLTMFSEVAMKETLNFLYDRTTGAPKHGKIKTGRHSDPHAATVNHGDHVMAAALAWLVIRGWRQQVEKEEKTLVRPGTLAWRIQYHDNLRKREQHMGHLRARGCGSR
jgi:hypothetical protein